MMNTDSKIFYLDGFTLVYTKIMDADVSTTRFPLREISKEELLEVRKTCDYGFVFKKDGKTYFTELPKHFPQISKLENLSRNHLCADCPCDNLNICQKFLNNSRYIENYDYISLGFETFSKYAAKESFVVYSCSIFENTEHKERKKISIEKFNRAKRNIADLYFNW